MDEKLKLYTVARLVIIDEVGYPPPRNHPVHPRPVLPPEGKAQGRPPPARGGHDVNRRAGGSQFPHPGKFGFPLTAFRHPRQSDIPQWCASTRLGPLA